MSDCQSPVFQIEQNRTTFTNLHTKYEPTTNVTKFLALVEYTLAICN